MPDKKMPEPEISEDEVARSNSLTPTTRRVLVFLPSPPDPGLTEDFALSLLKRPDLHPQVLEQLSKNASVNKSRKIRIALASHPHTPRHVSVPLARQFYTFDLMKVALSPGVPADVKVAIDDILIARLEMVTIGERLTLARRASGRVAAALLVDTEKATGQLIEGEITDRKVSSPQTRITRAALDNSRLTEALVINSVLHAATGAALVRAVARHEKWSPRKEIRAALLRTEYLSLASALAFARTISPPVLREILQSSRLPEKIKDQLLRECSCRDALGANLRHYLLGDRNIGAETSPAAHDRAANRVQLQLAAG